MMKTNPLMNNEGSTSLALGLLLLALSGCGGAEATVSGSVTLDGNPLEKGTVMFVPTEQGTQAATGVISGGSYWVQVATTGGLKPGTYQATVTATGPSIPNPGGGPPAPGKLLTPKKYSNPSTSGLEVTVESGSNSIDLELTSQ